MDGLTVYEELEQGSEAWLQARCGVLTASVIGKLITEKTLKLANNDTSRGLVATLGLERATGVVEYVHPSWEMQRGTDDEPWARSEYETHHNPVTELGFMVREFDGYSIGYSPDGLVGENGLIEIKSRSRAIQAKTIMTDEVPAANMAQIMTGLLVTGRDWLDYVSYRDGMPLYVKRVYPDPIWFDVLKRAAVTFEVAVEQYVTNYTEAASRYPLTEERPDEMEFTF